MSIKFICNIFLISICVSCSLFSNNNEHRTYQTKVLANMSEKSVYFSKCAENSDLFDHFARERIRTVIYLSLNKAGGIEKFKLDEKNYPESFTSCVFEALELISFPKTEHHDIVKMVQPFIFSQK
jgi:hypothetical protein